MTKQIPYDLIPAADLPKVTSGAFDSVVGVDESTGAARRFPMPVTGAPKAYETRADLPVSASEGTAAYVNNDPNPDNNGLWAVFGGVWVRSADRVTGLEGRLSGNERVVAEHQEKLAGQLVSVPKDEDVLLVVDKDGMVTLRQSADGGLHLPGLEGSVQDMVGRPGTTYVMANRLVDVEDEDGLLVAGFLEDGEVFTPKHPAGVGRSLERYPAFPVIDPRLSLRSDAAGQIDELTRLGALFASPPQGLLPQQYSVRDSFIDDLVIPPQSEYHPIDTPYGLNDRVVHPHVIEFRVPFRGYRYLMCLTPYSYEQFENPVIYGGNNLKSWEMLDGFRQPLDEPALSGEDWNSDNGFSYDPTDGALVCYWRRSSRTGEALSQIFAKKTWDGFRWTETFEIIPKGEDKVLSPSLLFDPVRRVWMMWSFSDAAPNVRLREATSITGPWSDPVACTGISGWHGEVKYVGGKLVALQQGSSASNYWLSVSADGVTWTKGADLFPSQQEAVYKASFLPVLSGNQIALDIVWTTNHHSVDDLRRRLFVARTNFISM